MRPTHTFANYCAVAAAALWMLLLASGPAHAQLRITEVMYNPMNEDRWEWIEVQNLGEEINLDGAFMDGLNDPDPPLGASPNISNLIATNTVIPAGGAAVLYDGFQGQNSPISYNDQLFRDAWGLNGSVPLIAVDFWPGLPNSSGDVNNLSIGIWADRGAYNMDITGEPGSGTVTSFANALASVNYDVAAPWPGSENGVSISYSGNGDVTDGGNWLHSSVDNGASTSVLVEIQDSINSMQDVGNPGLHSPVGGSAPEGQLLITEIMFNPRSAPDNDFEWFEVLNNTGSAIDFSSTGYFFDDSFSSDLTEANVNSGGIDDGETAILFNANSLTFQDMEGIWGDDINFIPVSDWSALNNSDNEETNVADSVGLWGSQGAYDADAATGPDGNRGVTMAAASVIYSTDDQQGWPVPDGNGSIWLMDLAGDPNLGGNWILAEENDGFGISYHATEISGIVEVHPGGDVGSPGVFAVDTGGVPGDYNDDGVVNAGDYIVWRNNEGQSFTLTNEMPEPTTPGVPDQEDYLFWVSRFGETSGAGSSAAVPEPTAAMLCLLAVTGLTLARRRAA